MSGFSDAPMYDEELAPADVAGHSHVLDALRQLLANGRSATVESLCADGLSSGLLPPGTPPKYVANAIRGEIGREQLRGERPSLTFDGEYVRLNVPRDPFAGYQPATTAPAFDVETFIATLIASAHQTGAGTEEKHPNVRQRLLHADPALAAFDQKDKVQISVADLEDVPVAGAAAQPVARGRQRCQIPAQTAFVESNVTRWRVADHRFAIPKCLRRLLPRAVAESSFAQNPTVYASSQSSSSTNCVTIGPGPTAKYCRVCGVTASKSVRRP